MKTNEDWIPLYMLRWLTKPQRQQFDIRTNHLSWQLVTTSISTHNKETILLMMDTLKNYFYEYQK